jgi:RNA polymerase sigma factor (sigma-70 family)
MASGLPQVIERLRLVGSDLTDGELLARFAATRDEASFTALLRRHGPMVLGVCRRVLGHHHDAEDAFQATFLVLAQKGSSVRKRDSVGCWLYGVAYRTAQEAANANARRQTKERQVRDMPHPLVAPSEVPDWRPLLDRELSRLSEKYRSAVVLCDLEGKANKEAARLLDVPESTLANRLARARALLAKRLRGRGVEWTGAALAAALAAETASAAVPAALVNTTARAAAGQLTAASAPAVLLMKGVIRAMLMKKLRLAALAALVTTALGAVGLSYRPAEEARAQAGGGTKGGGKRPAQPDHAGEQVTRSLPEAVAAIREALNCDIRIEENVQVSLPQALLFLEDSADKLGKRLAILVDSKAIQRANEGAAEVETTAVRLTKRSHPVPLKLVLREILGQYQSSSPGGELTFAVINGIVLVGPTVALREMVRNQPVSMDADGIPLRQVLKQLSDRTGVHLILDSRVKEESKATLAVAEMPLHTAVHLLAEMADLRVVELPAGDVFLTTAERADRLRQQQKEGLFPAEKPLQPAAKPDVRG